MEYPPSNPPSVLPRIGRRPFGTSPCCRSVNKVRTATQSFFHRKISVMHPHPGQIALSSAPQGWWEDKPISKTVLEKVIL